MFLIDLFVKLKNVPLLNKLLRLASDNSRMALPLRQAL